LDFEQCRDPDGRAVIRLALRWGLGLACALVVGTWLAIPYARIAAPYYHAVAEIIAEGRPWDIGPVEVVPSVATPGSIVRLTGFVRHYWTDATPSARLVSKIQAATVIETPLIFWTVILLWPIQSWRRRLMCLLLGIPIFLGLEAATTVCQLLNALAYASAVLSGERDPLTLWERWSRFLESGGRPVLAFGAALITVAPFASALQGPRPSPSSEPLQDLTR
jgi:hypothetical protein